MFSFTHELLNTAHRSWGWTWFWRFYSKYKGHPLLLSRHILVSFSRSFEHSRKSVRSFWAGLGLIPKPGLWLLFCLNLDYESLLLFNCSNSWTQHTIRQIQLYELSFVALFFLRFESLSFYCKRTNFGLSSAAINFFAICTLLYHFVCNRTSRLDRCCGAPNAIENFQNHCSKVISLHARCLHISPIRLLPPSFWDQNS